MNRVIKVFLCWMLLIAVSISAGCGKEEEEQEYDYWLYFLDSTETKVVSEGYTMRAVDIEGQIAEMLEAINSAEPDNFQSIRLRRIPYLHSLLFTLQSF